jgi:crotonobetaine/carnitine-CoA ligase
VIDAAGLRTIGDLLDERVADSVDVPALVVEGSDGRVVSFTYGELDVASRRVAGGLVGLGIESGDRVLAHLPNCPEIVVLWLALARLGAVLVPSNVANTAREVGHIARTAEVRLGVCRVEAAGLLAASDAIRLAPDRLIGVGGAPAGSVDFADLALTQADPPLARPNSTDVAELVFTSGTTAAPKAAMITHANCLNSGLQKAAAMEIGSHDRLLSALPLFHVNAQSALFTALVGGATFVSLESYSAARYCTQLAEHGATVTSLVSTQVRTMLKQPDHPDHRAHSVDRAWFALDLTEAEREEFTERFGIRLLNGYGLTEAFTSVCQTPLRGAARWPSVGLPLIGRHVRVVDAPGEIVIGGVAGRTVMAGYWADPEATARTLRNGWLHTGDVGAIDAAGYLTFVGRKADMIKRAGENIAAAEVEAVLLAHPDVVEAAVLGLPDPIRDEEVVAFVALTPSSATSAPVLDAYARERLAAFKVPTRWAIRAELPKSSIGKINKGQLRAEAPTDAQLRPLERTAVQ